MRAALRNRQLSLVLLASCASTISEWALWIGALVYAHDRGGASVAGLVSIALVVPAAIVAPIAGSAADGPRPNRLLASVFGAQALCLVVAAVAAYRDAPLLIVVVPIAATTTLVTFIRPSYSVVIPGLVTAPEQLTAANVLVGYVENTAILVGPLLAGALLALHGAALVLAACAALSVISTLCTAPLVRLDPPLPVTSHPLPRPSSSRMLLAGARRLADKPGAAALLLVLGGEYALIGGLDLLYVVLAADQLHLDSSGPGLLSAAFGAGAVVGGALTTLLVARRRLAPLLVASLVAIVAALFALSAHTALAAALLALPVMGVGRALLDVTGHILLQRAAPQDALASVFATLEAMKLVGSAIGSLLVQILVATAGPRAALLGLGCSLGLLAAVTFRRLRQVDQSADAPVVAIRLLKSTVVFSPLPPAAMESLARAGRMEHVAAGATIMRTGDRGDRYFTIAGGQVEVFVDNKFVRTMSRPEGFGEIALLADLPRTATVVAATDVDLLSIDRAAFLTAVTGHDASRQAAWGAARRYGAVAP
jgi:predicted MFS family arabinose efflux permease